MITLAEAQALLALPNSKMLPPSGVWYNDRTGKG